jgi:hypothetical protein
MLLFPLRELIAVFYSKSSYVTLLEHVEQPMWLTLREGYGQTTFTAQSVLIVALITECEYI